MLDDALLFLYLGLEVRALCLAALDFLLPLEIEEVVVQRGVELRERFAVEFFVLRQRNRRHVDAPAVRVIAGFPVACTVTVVERFVVHPRVDISLTQARPHLVDEFVQPLEIGLIEVVDGDVVVDAGAGTQFLAVEAAEVQLRRQRPHEVSVGFLDASDKPVVIDSHRVEPRRREFVGRPGCDGSGFEPDRFKTVDDLAVFVQHGDVPVAEQLRDDSRRRVLAVELQFDDAVELELLDADEVSARQPVPEHHREVRRAARCVGDVTLVGSVGALDVADFDEELDAPAVEVPELQSDEVVLGVEVRLVELRAS